MSIKTQWICIIRNIVLCRQPHMFLSLFMPVHMWNSLFIWVILFNNLSYPYSRKATCLEITNILLAVPSTCIPIYISVTLNYPFIGSGRLLHIIWLPFAISMEEKTQLVSYQIIGATPIAGDFFIHCYFGW